MAPPRNRIADILLKAGVVDELQMRSALAQYDQWGGRLTRVIADLGFAREDVLTDTLVQALRVPRVQVGHARDAAALTKVDVTLAEQKAVFPVQLRDGGKTLVLAMADPTDLATVDLVAMRGRVRVQVGIAGDREIEAAIQRHYRGVENPEALQPTRRSVVAGAGAIPRDDEEDGDEFKVVDAAGKTVVRHLSDIMASAPPPTPEPVAPPPAPPLPPPVAESGASVQSAADMLDEILAGEAGAREGFSPEELQRLETLKANQEKSSLILRALLELMAEKRLLTPQELAGRMRS